MPNAADLDIGAIAHPCRRLRSPTSPLPTANYVNGDYRGCSVAATSVPAIRSPAISVCPALRMPRSMRRSRLPIVALVQLRSSRRCTVTAQPHRDAAGCRAACRWPLFGCNSTVLASPHGRFSWESPKFHRIPPRMPAINEVGHILPAVIRIAATRQPRSGRRQWMRCASTPLPTATVIVTAIYGQPRSSNRSVAPGCRGIAGDPR